MLFEEGGEMVGTSLFISALLGYLAYLRPRIDVRMLPDNAQSSPEKASGALV